MRMGRLVLVALALPLLAADPEPDPARLPRKPPVEPMEVEGQIVLIGHKDAERPLPGATRTKEEALSLARRVAAEARSKGTHFEDLVRRYSEDPYKEESLGEVGRVPRGGFPVHAVEEALFDIGEGQVTDPIDTPSGWVVAIRLPFETCADQIVVAWKECKGARVERTREEALARTRDLRRRVVEGKEDFGAVAKECSDDPAAEFLGHLGIVRRGSMPRAVEAAAFALAAGEVSEPVETESGFHLIRARTFAHSSHVLVSFREAERHPEGVTRTREEAKERVEKVLARIRGGEDFRSVAAEASDDPESGSKGGDLGAWEPGHFDEAFEKALFALTPGEVSGPVETRFGFHVIVRWR